MRIHFIPNENMDIGNAICYIHPKDLEPLKNFKCGVCKDEGWIITDNGLTSSPFPMNCKEHYQK